MNPKTHPTYCHYPFHAMTFKKWSKDGKRPINVTPCCMMMNPVEQGEGEPDRHFNMGLTEEELIGKNPLEIFNSPQYQKLRDDLTNGVRNEACNVCWKMEDNGLKSFRQCSSLEGGSEGLFEFDLTLSNLCNLACRMCNMGSSHQIGKDIDAMLNNGSHKLFQEVSGHAMPLDKGVNVDFKTSNAVIDWLMNNTHQITMLKASGGEPFYDRRVVKVLEKYVKDGNAKNTTLKFHTNATQFTPELATLLNEFKSQGHTFSIDGTGKVYNYIRHLSDWEKLNESLDCYFSTCKNIDNQYFNMVLSAYNVMNAGDYIEWVCNKCQYHGVPNYYIHFSEMFPYHRGSAVKNVPNHLLEIALDRIIEVLDGGIAYVASSDTVQATIRGKEYKAWYRFDLHNLVAQIDAGIKSGNRFFKNLKVETELLDRVRDVYYFEHLDKQLSDLMIAEIISSPEYLELTL